MDLKSLRVMAELVDAGNEIQNEMEDIETAISLLLNDKKAAISIAVYSGEYILPVSDMLTKQQAIKLLRERRFDLIEKFDQL